MQVELKLTFKKIVMTLIFSILLWSILTNAWGYTSIIFGDERNPIWDYIFGYLIRTIWVTPFLYLIIKYSKELKWSYIRLFTRPVINKSFLVVLLVIIIYPFVSMLLIHGQFWINPNEIIIALIIKFIIVGIVEETVYRGWGYNALIQVVSERNAIVITLVFFVMLHCPAYIIKLLVYDNLSLGLMFLQFTYAIILGLVFIYLLRKSGSLTNSIIIHCLFDILMVLFVG